jgi:uncharacterized protein involved in cysteine biosynthesis
MNYIPDWLIYLWVIELFLLTLIVIILTFLFLLLMLHRIFNPPQGRKTPAAMKEDNRA